MSCRVDNKRGSKRWLRGFRVAGIFLLVAGMQVGIWDSCEPVCPIVLRNTSTVPVQASGTVFNPGRHTEGFHFTVEPGSGFTVPDVYLAPGGALRVELKDRKNFSIERITLPYAKADRLAVISVGPRFDIRTNEGLSDDDFSSLEFDAYEGAPLTATLTPVRLILLAGLLGWIVTISYRPWLLRLR